MTEKIITLDSLEKIEQFSKGLAPYTRAPQLLSGNPTIPGLFVGGSPAYINNLITYTKDKNLEDQDGRIPQFENEVQISESKPISEELNKNLGYLGYPCLKANFTTFAREKTVKYPVILVNCWLDGNGDILQVSGDFFINDNRNVNDPKTFFIPFESEPEIVESTVFPPTNTKEEIDNLINTIAVPDLEKCPPKKISNFYANDQSWGIVPLETKQTKSLLVENRGETRLVVTDFNPKSDKYFTIVNPISNFELQPGESKTFEVEYTPFDEAEATHKMVVKFDVYEDGDLTKPITGEKLISVLTGTGDLRDLIDDVIDDFGGGVLVDDDNGTYV
jgi:hypothetical protein